MRLQPNTRLLPGLLLLAFTAGCALTEPVVRPDLELPAQWTEAAGAATASAPVHDTWWRGFGSATLDALVSEALAAAPDLRIQAERVVQAELALRQAGASLFPTLDFSAGSAARNVDSNETNTSSLGLGASYELDLWGRIAAGVDASRAGLAATRFDHDAARLSMSASLATTWF
ncbi:MAG: TolC family protein, partial [Thauera sp.]